MPSQGYASGLCILHLGYLLAGASGEERLRNVTEEAGLTMLPGFDFGAFAGVAKDIAERFRLL